MALSLPLVLYAVAGLFALALGVLLLATNRRHPPNSALAAFVLTNALLLALLVVARVLPQSQVRDVMVFPQQALVLASMPLMLLFVALYPEDLRRGWWPRAVAWGSVLALVVMETAYFVDWRLYKNWGVPGILAGQDDFGPLLYAVMAFEALAFAAAFLLLRDAMRLPAGSRRNAVVLVSFGFLLYGPLTVLGDDVKVLLQPALRTYVWTQMQASAEWWALMVPRMAVLLLFLALLGYAVFLAARSPDADARGRARWYAGGLLAVFFVSLALEGAQSALLLPAEAVTDLVEAPRFSLMAVVVGYAFIRHQLYAADVRVRRTLRRGALAGALVSGTLGVVTLVQTLFPQVSETAVWVTMTTLAALLQGPLRRGAERLESWVVPAGPDPLAQDADEAPTAAGLYQGLAARFWRGDHLSREDRRLLAQARKVTQLDEAEALRIEEEAALDATRTLVPVAGADAAEPPVAAAPPKAL